MRRISKLGVMVITVAMALSMIPSVRTVAVGDVSSEPVDPVAELMPVSDQVETTEAAEPATGETEDNAIVLYPDGIDFMTTMIQCAIDGDHNGGYQAEIYRNLKIDNLGLTETKTTYDEIREMVDAIVYSPNYLELMIQAVVDNNDQAGYIAQEARDYKIDFLGLPYKKVLYDELKMLAKIISQEAGSSWASDEHQLLVGSVVLNRIASPEFPNTMLEVLTAPRQYGGTSWKRAVPDYRTVCNAASLLQTGSVAPVTVVFQAEFRQGSGTYLSIYDKYLGTTTYFCYSSHPSLYENIA